MVIKVGKFRINLDTVAYIVEKPTDKQLLVYVYFAAVSEDERMYVELENEEAKSFLATYDHMMQTISAI